MPINPVALNSRPSKTAAQPPIKAIMINTLNESLDFGIRHKKKDYLTEQT